MLIIDKALKAYKTRDFDEALTKRMFKFENVQDLYKSIECVSALNDI
jgi:predicted alpha/beta-fold hydrolase